MLAVSHVSGEVEDYDRDFVKTLPSFEPPADFTPEEIEEVRTSLPSFYQSFIDVFHPRIGKEHLPPHQSFDMKINLKPGSSLAVGKLYELMSQDYIEYGREHIMEAKGTHYQDSSGESRQIPPTIPD